MADAAWGPLQLEHIWGTSHCSSCLSFSHRWHFAVVLQRWLVQPNLLQLKHCSGLGTNRSTFTYRYPTLSSFGMSGQLKVRNRVLVGITFPSFFTVTWWTSTTLWLFSSSQISTSDKSDSSQHLITPREEFSLMHRDVHRTINKSRSQQILHLGSSGALYEEGSVSQPLGALQGSGYSLEALMHREGRQLAQGLFLARRRHNYESGPGITCYIRLTVRIWIQIIFSCSFDRLVKSQRCHI